MNLLDKASIILTPSAYNNGEALCVKPSDGSGDFDFSRNSAATRVNAQGLVEDVQILSSNLVQNGNFSEQGAEEVSNGSFSQQGSQLITNGDFSNPSDWTMQAGWSISNGKLNALATNGIAFQSNLGLVIGKTYKVSLTTSNYVSGSARLKLGSSAYQNISTTDGNQEFYFIPTASNDNIIFSYLSTFTGSIDNVSVVEVGQNWEFGVGWGLGENKAISTGSQILSQPFTHNNKIYKYSFEVTDYISGNLRFRIGNGATEIIVSSNGVFTGVMQSAGGLNKIIFGDTGIAISCCITNISVKEVGQNWVLGTGWEIGNNVAISDTTASNLTPSTTLVSGEKYKFTLDVAKITSGNFAFLLRFNGTNTTIATINTEGSFTFYATADATGFRLQNLSGSTTDFSVTNITAVQITSDTNLPRINYEGFSYQDALGSELVLNGDFSNGVTNWNAGGGATISVANNQLTIEADNDFNFYARQTVSGFIVGKQYKLTIDVAGGTTSKINVGVFGEGILINNQPIVIGKQSVIFTITNGADGNRFLDINNRNDDGVNDTLIINSVSIKEYKGQEVVPDSGCGSWLWEPQSTNLITQSELFSDSSWIKLGGGTGTTAVVTSNYAISPDGTQNATRLVCDLNGGTTTSDQSLIYDLDSSNTSQSISIYMKSNTGSNQNIYFANTFGTGDTVIVTSEWQRFEFNHSTSNHTFSLGLRGNTGADNTADILIWAAQSEAGSYPTSYIPTSGTSVTRNRDVCTNGGTGTGLINSTEGVLYFEGRALANDGTYRSLTISDGTDTNRVSLSYTPTINTLSAFVRNTAGAVFSVTTTLIDSSTISKYAIKYKENDFALWVNGVEVATDTSGTTFNSNTLDSLSFDKGNGGDSFYGKTKCVAVWKEALTDLELQELTTI